MSRPLCFLLPVFTDPDYLAFLEAREKGVDSLPSAEVQLEKAEAEQAATGAPGG